MKAATPPMAPGGSAPVPHPGDRRQRLGGEGLWGQVGKGQVGKGLVQQVEAEVMMTQTAGGVARL